MQRPAASKVPGEHLALWEQIKLEGGGMKDQVRPQAGDGQQQSQQPGLVWDRAGVQACAGVCTCRGRALAPEAWSARQALALGRTLSSNCEKQGHDRPSHCPWGWTQWLGALDCPSWATAGVFTLWRKNLRGAFSLSSTKNSCFSFCHSGNSHSH